VRAVWAALGADARRARLRPQGGWRQRAGQEFRQGRYFSVRGAAPHPLCTPRVRHPALSQEV